VTATLAGIAAWVGCSIYQPSLLLPATQESGADVASDTSARDVVTSDAPGPGPCPETFPPPRPATDDPSDAGTQAVVVALHTLDFGIRDDGGAPPLYGYDLDQVFTCCDGGTGSCTPPVTGTRDCDEPGARDNSGGQLIASLALLDPGQFNSTNISANLQVGAYSLLIQLSDYNGQPNDTEVVAGLYASDGIEGVGDAAPPLAKWDGTDVWTIDDGFVLSGGDASPLLPNHFDAHAYVSGGVLVMQVNFPIALGTSATGNVAIDLTGGVISGQLVPVDGGVFRLESGQVAGRWSVPSVLLAVQGLTLGGQSICPGSSLYSNVKTQICTAADISTDPTQDNKGQACNALSIGFGFTADPAHLGDIVGHAAHTSLCDGGADAAPDDCTTP